MTGVLASALLVACDAPSRSLQDRAPFRSDSTIVGTGFQVPTGGALEPAREGELAFVAEVTTFIDELGIGGHRDDALEGETLIGVYAPLRFRYGTSDEVHVEAGALVGHNYGDDKGVDVTEPLFRLVYEPREDLAFVAGTIFPTHRVHEALLDDEVRLRDPVEEGIQLLHDGERWQQDFWLDWRIREEDDRREVFDVGNVSRVRVGPVWLDGQLLWFHAGGQKNSVSGVENNTTLLGGASLPLALNESTELTSRVAFLHTDEDGDVEDFTGNGVEGRLELRRVLSSKSGFEAFVSYYQGDELQTRRGDPLFRLNDYAQLGARYHHEAAGGLRVDLEALLSFAESEMDYRFAILFSWGQVFRLWDLVTGDDSDP